MSDTDKSYSGWAILELLGHRRLAGRVCQEEQYGAAMIRIDIPGPDGTVATQWYSPAALYALTPTTEEIARQAAQLSRPEPVTAWELRALEPPKRRVVEDDDDEDDIGPDPDFDDTPF